MAWPRLVGVALSVAASGGVLANDTDLDGDTLTVSSVSDTAHGAGMVGHSLAGGLWRSRVIYASFARDGPMPHRAQFS
jgi:hypothetical protein